MKTVSTQEMMELDSLAIEVFGIPSIILMENAGRSVAEVAKRLEGTIIGKKVAIFCGIGNNGGDGFVAARYLRNEGADLSVYIIGDRSKIKNGALVNLNILEKMNVRIKEISCPVEIHCELIIDSIFGIGLKGVVLETYRSIIEDINSKTIPIISVDVPSGLDADKGESLGAAIRATKTVTMQFPKKGFYINLGPLYTGEVIVVDIGIPV